MGLVLLLLALALALTRHHAALGVRLVCVVVVGLTAAQYVAGVILQWQVLPCLRALAKLRRFLMSLWCVLVLGV